MRVAIIGAGFAGVVTAKVMRQYGHDVTVFEKAPDVGGVWSATRRYPGLSTQNNKDTYCLSDQPWPKSVPEWPSGAQVQQYVEIYARRFGVDKVARLNTEVLSAEQRDGGWQVTAEGPGGRTTEDYDAVVVSNGIFSRPKIPAYPGAEEFEAAGGRVCAPSDIHDLTEVEGKNVLVVGYGKSGCDIAVTVCDAAASTTMVARQLIWKMPKKLMGKLNFKYLMMNRAGEGLFEYQQPTPFEKVLHGPGKPVRDAAMNGLAKVATFQHKLDELGLVPEGPFENIGRSTVSLTTDGFFEGAQDGTIKVVRDAVIARLEVRDGQRVAVLSSGDAVPCDMVIAATGWHQDVPFLSAELMDRITDERGNYELFRQILPHDVPGLYFCGYNSSFFSPLSAEVAALWIVEHLDGRVLLPPLEERKKFVAERLRWMEWRTDNHHARGTNVIPFSMHGIDDALSDLGIRVGPAQRALEWALPIVPGRYRWVTDELLARRADEEWLAGRSTARAEATATAHRRSGADEIG